MACGTPVLAFRHGSVPEIIDQGVTGIVIDGIEDAAGALPQVMALDRRKVRARFDERFSAARMARDYAKLYRAMLMPPRVISMTPRAILPTRHEASQPRLKIE
jgi:glycosyltransferase involved in cell wall biosynthesis